MHQQWASVARKQVGGAAARQHIRCQQLVSTHLSAASMAASKAATASALSGLLQAVAYICSAGLQALGLKRRQGLDSQQFDSKQAESGTTNIMG